MADWQTTQTDGLPHRLAGSKNTASRAHRAHTASRAHRAALVRKLEIRSDIQTLCSLLSSSRSCQRTRWKWPAFYAIAQLLEFLDHSGRACALRLGTHRRAPFFIADPLMQDHPEQSAKPVGDGPDGLLYPKCGTSLRNVISNMLPWTFTADWAA